MQRASKGSREDREASTAVKRSLEEPAAIRRRYKNGQLKPFDKISEDSDIHRLSRQRKRFKVKLQTWREYKKTPEYKRMIEARKDKVRKERARLRLKEAETKASSSITKAKEIKEKGKVVLFSFLYVVAHSHS